MTTFSSSDKIENPDASTSFDQENISDANFEWYFEIDSTSSWISANSFKTVALQFPDELLNYSAKVSTRLESQIHFKPYILADTSFGSCCVDDIAAQHINADCIVHYGEACLSKIQKGHITVKYILPKRKINIDEFIDLFDQWFTSLKVHVSTTVSILADTCYYHASDEISKALSKHVTSNQLTLKLNELSSSIDIPSQHVLYIGSKNSTRITLLSLANPESKFHLFDPINKPSEVDFLDLDSNRVLRRRLYLIEKARDAQVVGIVVGTVNVDNYLKVVDRLKSLCRQSSKRFYVLFVGKPNVAKLANFLPQIDIFILLSCPFGVILDRKEFASPILTPFEFEQACLPNSLAWSCGNGWKPESHSVLHDEEKLQHILDNQDHEMEAEVSLTQGGIRRLKRNSSSTDDGSLVKRSDAYQLEPITAAERFNDLEWKGLEEKIGETPVSKIEQGRRGIASSYDDER